LLVADKVLNAVFAVTVPYFGPSAYSAVSVFSTPTAPNPIESLVGQTNLSTGFVTPIVTGMGNPGGISLFLRGGSGQIRGGVRVDPGKLPIVGRSTISRGRSALVVRLGHCAFGLAKKRALARLLARSAGCRHSRSKGTDEGRVSRIPAFALTTAIGLPLNE
jgi:hypothetical protein